MSKIEEVVREKYGAVAASELAGDHAGVRAVAEAFGYSPEELDTIAAGANMGLSCGNPTATANLRPGEVVVDLGSGGGIDVFLAAKKVGPTGKAIGIDMTPEMIDWARINALKAEIPNAEFRLGVIDQLPLEETIRSTVSSLNCVDQLGIGQAGVGVPGNVSRTQAGWPGGGVGHRPQTGTARRTGEKRRCPRWVRGRRGTDRGLRARPAGGGIRGGAGGGHRQRPERLREGREPVGVLLAADRDLGYRPADGRRGRHGSVGFGGSHRTGGLARAVRRERVRGERPGVRGQGTVTKWGGVWLRNCLAPSRLCSRAPAPSL